MRTVACATIIFAVIFPPPVFSQDVISSPKILESALEKAVMCKANELNVFYGADPDYGPDDARLQLETLGVKVTKESQHGGEIKFQFPPGVKVFGFEANEAIFFDQSTMIFFITLRADSHHLQEISKTLNLVSVPKGNLDAYGYFNEINVRYIRKLIKDKDIPPDTIFSGTGNNGDHIVVGCQNLAW